LFPNVAARAALMQAPLKGLEFREDFQWSNPLLGENEAEV
jgi:hypothetical protein